MKTAILRVLVALLIATATLIPAQRARGDEVAAQTSTHEVAGGLGGSVWAFAQLGDYAYIAEGNRLVVVDIRDPVQPARIAQVALSAQPFKLAPVGSVVVVFEKGLLSGFALQLIDVTNPWQPILRSRYDNLEAADVFGTLLYMATFNQLQVVDLQNAAHPMPRGSSALQTIPTVLMATESTLYLATCAGLETIDVTQPDAPQHRGNLGLPTCVHALDKVGPIVYAAGENHVWAVDVSDPTAPQLRASSELNGIARNIQVVDGTAFTAVARTAVCCEPPNAISWFDVHSSVVVEPLGTYPVTATTNLVSPEQFVYIGTPTGLVVLDASDPRNVAKRGEYTIDGGVNSLALAGRLLYIATSLQGLRVLDMRNPNEPVLLPDNRFVLSSISYLKIAQQTAFVSDGRQLVLLSLRDPTNPVLRARFTLGDGLSLMQVRAENGIAYVALGGSLWVVDIHDPDAPLLLARLDGPAQDVAVAGGVVSVAAGVGGIVIVDASDPAHPLVVGTFATTGEATRVWRNGELAYAADAAAGLLVIDVSQPQAPRLRGSYPLPYGFRAIVVDGALAYIHRGDAVEVVDLSAPDAPHLRGRTLAPFGGMWLEGDRIYISTYRHIGPGADAIELAVIDVRNPDQPRLLTDKVLAGYGSIVPFGELVFFTRLSRYAPGELQTIDTTMPGALQVLDRLPLACGYGPHQRVGDLLYLACHAAGLTIIRVQRHLLPVKAQIGPAGGALQSIGGNVRLTLPPAAVAVTATISYHGLREPAHPLPLTKGIVSAFTLTGTEELQRAATLTVTYSIDQLRAASIGSGAQLALVRWDGVTWRRLTPCDECILDTDHHQISVPLEGWGEFALVGERNILLLPLVRRSGDR